MIAKKLCIPRPRTRCFVTFATKHGTPDLWLKGNLVVLAAMVADYLKSLGSIASGRRLFCPAFCAPLRCHQILLVKDLLFLFREYKSLLTLYADSFNIGHRNNLLDPWVFRYALNITHLKGVSP